MQIPIGIIVYSNVWLYSSAETGAEWQTKSGKYIRCPAKLPNRLKRHILFFMLLFVVLRFYACRLYIGLSNGRKMNACSPMLQLSWIPMLST